MNMHLSIAVTSVLSELGYWPSFNIAYIPEIYSWSGYPANKSASDGYLGAPRARIFRREAPKVVDWADFKHLIRYNNFENDPICAPLSQTHKRSGDCAISARGDLPGPHGGAFGGIDAKVIKVSNMHSVQPPTRGSAPPAVEAQAGPSHDQQPPFRWAQFPNISHIGLPEEYDFDWITIA